MSKTDKDGELRINLTESIKSQRSRELFTRCQKYALAVTMFFGIAIFAFSFSIPAIIHHVIQTQVEDKTVMTQSNYQLWGVLPGESEIKLYRKISIFTPLNMKAIFKGESPIVQENSNVYELIQNQAFTNCKFIENGDVVSCGRQTTFDEHVPNNNLFEIANPGVFGGWYIGQHLSRAKLTWMTMGAVLDNVRTQIPNNVYKLGMKYQFMDTETHALSYFGMIQDAAKKQRILHDIYMGVMGDTSSDIWVYLMLEDEYGPAYSGLKNYFDLTASQMSQIRTLLINNIKVPLDRSAFVSYGCNPIGTHGQYLHDCTGKYLLALQFSNQMVTKQPPLKHDPPIDGPSVSVLNTTLHDMIEVNYFYEEKFKDKYPELTFDVEWMLHFLDRNYDYDGTNNLQDDDILQHKGNVEYIFKIGEQFDAQGDQLTILQPLADRFHTTTEHMHVIWEWLKQMEVNFAQRQNFKGSKEHAIMGSFGSEALYYPFTKLVAFLLPELVSSLVAQTQYTCKQFFGSIDDLGEDQFKTICEDATFKQINKDSILEIYNLCEFDGYGPRIATFQKKHKLTTIQLVQMCTFDSDSPQDSYQKAFYQAQNTIGANYGCPNSKCSKYDLAFKQWVKSDITLNPLAGKPKSYTVSDWDKSVFPNGFEYGYFQEEFKDKPEWLEVITEDQAKLILHFQGLFNTLQVTTVFCLAEFKDDAEKKAEFTRIFQFTNQEALLNYIRFTTIQTQLGGWSVKKTPKDLFFGYADPLGEDLKSRDPAGQGDKGINSWVRFGDPNMTVEDSQRPEFQFEMYTGKSDSKKVRQYKSYWGSQNVQYNHSYFDGNTVTQVLSNPWKADEVITTGTDGLIFHPFLESNQQLGFYLPQVYRSLKYLPTPGPKIFDLETIHYEIDLKVLDVNPVYDNKYSGTINLAKVQEAPVIISFPHFYGADQKLKDSVIIQDKNGVQIKSTNADMTFANLETYSGAPLQAVIQVMASIQIEPNLLFPYVKSSAIPLLTLYNSGNMTESVANTQYGQLKLGKSVAAWGWLLVMGVGLFFVLVGFAIVGWAVYQRKKRMAHNQSSVQTQ